MNYNCPHCDKSIVVDNDKSLYRNKGDLIIKSKLTFLNEDGKVLCKCSGCRKIVALPFDFKSKTINQN